MAASAPRGYRVGDRLWMLDGTSFVAVEVVEPANRGGSVGLIRVRRRDGRSAEVSVRNCYADGAAFRAWVRLLTDKEAHLRAAAAEADAHGVVFGSPAASALPAGRRYRATMIELKRAGEAVRAHHPYR